MTNSSPRPRLDVKNNDIEPAFDRAGMARVSRRTGEGKTVFVLIKFQARRKEVVLPTRCGRFWISGTFCNLNFRSMACRLGGPGEVTIFYGLLEDRNALHFEFQRKPVFIMLPPTGDRAVRDSKSAKRLRVAGDSRSIH